MRVFPDTNVLIAALASRGLCADLMRSLLAEHDVVIGELVLVELRRNLSVKLRMPAARIDQALGYLEDLEHAPAAKPIRPAPGGISAADAAILESAMQAGADAFVTGDHALLELADYGAMPILSPRALWSRLRGQV